MAGIITKRRIEEQRGELFGRALEHFIFTELVAHSSYKELDYEINFWRTKSGQEVDFVLGGGETAIEVKGTGRVENHDLRGLNAFIEEYRPKKAILVCNENMERVHGKIRIIPWATFLSALWAGEIIGG